MEKSVHRGVRRLMAKVMKKIICIQIYINFAIWRRTPHFFLFQVNLTYMKRILHLVPVKNFTFKSSYNWFKIDILWLLRPLTAS